VAEVRTPIPAHTLTRVAPIPAHTLTRVELDAAVCSCGRAGCHRNGIARIQVAWEVPS